MPRHACCLLLVATVTSCSPPAPRSAGPLSHDVYVWQRKWSSAVREATSTHATNFVTTVALAAEISWNNRQPAVNRVSFDPESLRQAGHRTGLALRIGPFRGPFDATDPAGQFIIHQARALVDEARSNRLDLAELQVDFDAAESQLDGYRVWTTALREAIRPVPLVLTTLPSWLNRPAFRRLVATTDGYVLQVHSLARPRRPDEPFDLCDPGAAARAVEAAGRIGVPFRVALPTYGYLLAFEPAGRFLGLSAEGPLRSWPEDTRLRELRASPTDMAALVRRWTADRPEPLRGVIWYRLPVPGDRLNWSWPTLQSVMAGRDPLPALVVEARRPGPALAELELHNRGDGDYQGTCTVRVQWRGARLLGSDGWQGFVTTDIHPTELEFVGRALQLPAGETRKLGWLRLDHETPIQVEILR